jgi:hypothetical protein
MELSKQNISALLFMIYGENRTFLSTVKAEFIEISAMIIARKP